MQSILISTCNSTSESLTYKILSNRAIVFNNTENSLSVKYDGVKNKVSLNLDNDTIVQDSDKNMSLNTDIDIKTLTLSRTVPYDGNKYIGSLTSTRTILLLVDTSGTGGISGTLYQKGSTVLSSYFISVFPSGTPSIKGAFTYTDKDYFVKATYNSKTYIGLKTTHGSSVDVFFNGFDNRNSSLTYDYVDSDLSNIEVL